MKPLLRWLGCLLIAAFALELFFILRIAAMTALDPESTAFQRSEAWQVAVHGRSNGERDWKQQWVPYAQISDSLKLPPSAKMPTTVHSFSPQRSCLTAFHLSMPPAAATTLSARSTAFASDLPRSNAGAAVG